MTIQCDHPRPKLDLPGYIPRRMAWQVPANIPGLPPEAQRVIRQALQGVYNELSRQGQVRNVIPLVDDLFVRPGSVVVGVADGQAITLLPPGADGYTDPVTVILTDVVDPITVVRPDGTTDSLGEPGSYDYEPAGGSYETSPGGAILGGSIPTDRLLGRDSPGTGAVEYIDVGPGLKFDDTGTVDVRFPGAPIYDVMAPPFNASGSLAEDDTAPINAAIAAANAAPGIIYLGARHRITAGLNPITNNNIRIVGRGEFNGGTILQVDSAAAVDAITISGCQYCSVERMWIVGTKVFASGYGIKFEGTFRCYSDHVVITSMCFGVEAVNTVFTECRYTHLGDLYGVYGFLAHGTGGNFNHAVRYEACVCGTNYPANVVGTARVWSAGLTVVTGNIVFSNGAIYQATSSGVTGATAPIGSGTTATNAHTTTISDGAVNWVFAMPLNVWFCQESGSQTFEIVDCGTLQGGYGLLVDDSTGSTPLFCRVQNLQIDHPFTAGIQLNAGAAIRMNQILVTSVQEGSGIVIASGVSGNWEIIGGEVFGCNKAGVAIARGDGLLEGIQIGACGGISANTRDCIEVTNSASRFRIVGCSGGAMIGGTSPSTRYGISIAAGSDNYAVVGNVFSGNLTAGILNTPGRASTRVLLNNVPDTTIAAGSVWGIQVDGATGVPFEITGLEVGELLRRETFVVETRTGTVTTLAVANITTQVVCKSTAALTFRGATATSATFGKTLEISMHAGFAGSITLKNEDASAAASLERFACPENTDLTLTAGQVAVLTYFDSRWRVVAVTRAGIGLTDGDKGDITVSSSGTAWTIDADAVTTTKILNGAVTDAKIQNRQPLSLFGRATNSAGQGADIDAISGSGSVMREAGGTINWGTIATAGITDAAVTLAKQANLAQSRVIGRSEGAGTGVPEALTPTQVVAIIDAENATWTGAHSFTGSSHTVDTAGAITMEGDSDCALASVTGGLALGAGHVVVSPSVDNLDVAINAKGGVAINAHATVPVTGAATGAVEITGTTFTATTTGAITLAASDDVNITPLDNCTIDVSNTLTLDGGAGVTLTSGNLITAATAMLFSSTVRLGGILTSTDGSPIDNKAIGAISVWRCTPNNTTTLLRGMVKNADSQIVYVVNVSTVNTLQVQPEDTSSTAANRFTLDGTSFSIGPLRACAFWYDGTSTRWRPLDTY